MRGGSVVARLYDLRRALCRRPRCRTCGCSGCDQGRSDAAVECRQARRADRGDRSSLEQRKLQRRSVIISDGHLLSARFSRHFDGTLLHLDEYFD